jgi:aspartyl-tRNA(Asn)/glutamyl-tRNA(Gln) amidotransferase subunit C
MPVKAERNRREVILELRQAAKCSGARMLIAGQARERERMTAKVSVEDVERVAELAHLKLTAEESSGMQRDLNAILDYVAELNELDTKGVAPLDQVSELAGVEPPLPRADLHEPSLDREVVMREAPETDGTFFRVPKVIERR